MAHVDPARRAMMLELAEWRRAWAHKWGIDDTLFEGETLGAWEARIPPEAEEEYRRRAGEIMATHRQAARSASSPDGRTLLPTPRSREEALFYMDLIPCARCGRDGTPWSASLTEVGGALARRYHGTCLSCGNEREFLFALSEPGAPRPSGARVWYGGDDPSRLFDAGQWLWMYERAAQGAREERERGDSEATALHAESAVAFVAEVAKFLPPGAQAVPESAFWTEIGRRTRASDPSRFTRRRLAMLLDQLREEFPGSGAPAVRLPLGRTSAEIHLYLDLHPCDCGESSFDRTSRLSEQDGDLVSRYDAACPRCGRRRSFSFRVPEEPVLSGPEGVHFRYGDDRPSELLDPGEWLAAADDLARSVPDLGPGADEALRHRFQHALGRAAAAVGEVMKFAPTGAAEVPASALRSERGRAVHRAEPGRFRLDRLDAVRSAYRRLLADAGLD